MSDDFAEAFGRVSVAVATHLAAVTESHLQAAVLDGFLGRLYSRTTQDETGRIDVEYKRVSTGGAHPWPGPACVYYELDAASYERVAAYVEGRSDVFPPPFKMESV